MTWLERLPGSQPWRRLFGAYVISTLGDEFTRVALFAKAYAVSGEVLGVAGVALAQAVPALLIAPVAGALADRGSKRGHLVACDLSRCALLVLIAFTSSLPLLLALAPLVSAFSAAFRPVEASLEAEILERADLLQASALRVGARQLLGLVGPAMAGASLGLLSTTGALLLDATTFAASAALLFTLPAGARRAAAPPGASLRAELRGGLRFIASDRALRALFVVTAALLLVMGMQGPLFYGFVVQRLGGGGREYGSLMSGLGAGSLIGALVLARWSSLVERGVGLVVLVLVLDGAALLAFSFATWLTVAVILMAAMGLISAAFAVTSRVLLQGGVPPELRGQVLGWFEGIQGPLMIASLAGSMALVIRWPAASILRGAALAELAIALACLAALRLGAPAPPSPPRGEPAA